MSKSEPNAAATAIASAAKHFKIIISPHLNNQAARTPGRLAAADVDDAALLAEVEKAPDGQGINVMTPEKGLVDLKKAGVIDPAKVTKEAVKNAVSIAATAITMGALIVNIPEKETPSQDMGGMY